MRRVPAALAALVLMLLLALTLWLAPYCGTAVARGSAERGRLRSAVENLQKQDQAMAAYAVFRAEAEAAAGTRRIQAVLQDIPFDQTPALLAGRLLLPADHAAGSALAVISDSFAARLFGSADCVGQTLTVQGERLTVVGVYACEGFSPLMLSRPRGNTVYTSYPFAHTEAYIAARRQKGVPARVLSAALACRLSDENTEDFVFSPLGERVENLCFFLIFYGSLWAAWLAGRAVRRLGSDLPARRSKGLAVAAGLAVLVVLMRLQPFAFGLSPAVGAALEGGGALPEVALEWLREGVRSARFTDDGTLMLNCAEKLAVWGVCCHGWLILWHQKSRGR